VDQAFEDIARLALAQESAEPQGGPYMPAETLLNLHQSNQPQATYGGSAGEQCAC